MASITQNAPKYAITKAKFKFWGGVVHPTLPSPHLDSVYYPLHPTLLEISPF